MIGKCVNDFKISINVNAYNYCRLFFVFLSLWIATHPLFPLDHKHHNLNLVYSSAKKKKKNSVSNQVYSVLAK